MKLILLGLFALASARPDGLDQPCCPGEHCPRQIDPACPPGKHCPRQNEPSPRTVCGKYKLRLQKYLFRHIIIYYLPILHSPANMPDFMKNADRIVGGQDVPKMIPWQVAISSDGFQFCGGTILDSCTILSAMHCQISTYDTIRAGSINKKTGGQV